MSARDVRIPNRAMLTSLGDILRRVVTLERRIMWPGAVQVVEDAADVNVSWVPAAPSQDPEEWGSWVEIAEVVVDSGRWTAIGGATFEGNEMGSSSAQRSAIRLGFDNGIDTAYVYASTSQPGSSAEAGFAALQAAGSASMTGEITVTLSASVGADGSLAGMDAVVVSDGFLVVIPG